MLAITLACGGESAPPDRVVNETLAGRLAGIWDVTLRLERPLSLSTDSRSLPRTVAGTMAILEGHSGQHSFEQMNGATHVGVYDVDLGALGFPSMDADIIPAVAAHVVAEPPASGHDSVHMLMNPETPHHFLRLTGTVSGDSIHGAWIAESFLGGGGTFVMLRRR